MNDMNETPAGKLKLLIYHRGNPIPETIEADCVIALNSSTQTPLAIIASWSDKADAFIALRAGDREFPEVIRSIAPHLPVPICKEVILE